MTKYIAIETIIIAIIAISDLIFSAVFIGHGKTVVEGNPMMTSYFKSLPLLIGIKLTLLVCPLYIIEYARTHSPKFTKIMSWICICLYVGSIAVGAISNLCGR